MTPSVATEYIYGERDGEFYKLFYFRRDKDFVFGFLSSNITATVDDDCKKTIHSSKDIHMTYHEDGRRHLRIKEITGKKISKLVSTIEPLNNITYQEAILMGSTNVERLDMRNRVRDVRDDSLVIPLHNKRILHFDTYLVNPDFWSTFQHNVLSGNRKYRA